MIFRQRLRSARLMSDADLSIPLHVGDVVADKYRIEFILGEGGMGVVLAARHLQLDERVAIKLLRPQYARSQELVARFIREARSAVRIRSAHVARVIDVDQLPGGEPYIVMEYLEGETLEHRLRRQRAFPVAFAVDCVMEACEAISEAHRLGIIHRDIKPSNLFLATAPNGGKQVKVLDFGIAKRTLAEDATPPPSSDMTRTKALMGTPTYMAPEQLGSARVADRRSDIWSLGVTLFELITGRCPFQANDYRTLSILITTTDALPVSSFRADVPPALDEVIGRCLLRDPDARYQTVPELCEELVAFGSKRALAAAANIAPPESSLLPPAAGESGDRPTERLGRGREETTSVGPPKPGKAESSKTHAYDPEWGAQAQKYRVLFPLGEGGTARVILAVAHGPAGFNKLVVLKILRSEIAADAGAVRMFLDEARLSSRLSHKNVVEVHEIFEHENVPVLVMAYLDGQPLSGILKQKLEIPLEMQLTIIAETLAGLHHAHELTDYDGTKLGVVHRDVSPQNVFVTFDGAVKVLDFGIAKLAWREHTRTGIIKGKLHYMSPEQILGDRSVDRRADVYAGGVLLWEALAGRRMFGKMSDPDVMTRVLGGQIPPPSKFRPDCPAALEATCMKALSRDPAQRHETAAELQQELEAFVRQRGGVSSHELASFMGQHFGEVREQRRKRIEAKLAQLDRLPVFGARPRAESPRPTPELPVEVGSRQSSSRDGSRVTFFWIGGALLAGALVTAIVMTFATGQTSQAERPVSSAPSPSPSPSGPRATVELRVTALPGHARVYIDGVLLPGNPYLDRVVQDGSTHFIKAEAEGYQTSTREVSYDRDVEIVLALQEVPQVEPATADAGADKPRSKPVYPRSRGRPVAAPSPAAPKPVRPDCTVPYVVDAKGIKRFKKECI